jgi:AGCS family alanine or glycine:cation symporter
MENLSVFMAKLDEVLSSVSGWIWGWPLIVLLLGTHLFLTFRLGFIQRYMGRAIRLSLTRTSEGEGDISHFGALMTALAATVGTGNIVGVASAVAMGGPGAVLWMWLTGVFGIATKYAEALLAVKYRVKMENGSMAGGPMYVLERALKMKWLGVVFAVLTAISGFGIGNMVQANALAGTLHNSMGVAPWVSGILFTALTALVILGGIRWIARVCEFFVPIMAIVYIVGCIALLAVGWATLGDTIKLIFTSAFTGQAAVGGFVGAGIREAIRYGVARGLFSNESGMGSAPILAAAAQTNNPVRQALVSASGTFWDTVVICAFTGLVVVNSGHWQEGLSKVQLTQAAFTGIPVVGPWILTFGMLTFVFSTILGWSYYGEQAVEYLFGIKAVLPYRIAWVIAVFVGSVASIDAVWNFADITNGLMTIPNIVSLWLLHNVIARETKERLSDTA